MKVNKMKNYIVRTKSNAMRPFELVGIFYCDFSDLRKIVDEATNPDICECAPCCVSGGIFFPSKAPIVHADYDDQDFASESIHINFTELLISNIKNLTWCDF